MVVNGAREVRLSGDSQIDLVPWQRPLEETYADHDALAVPRQQKVVG